jgi:predicted dehydrogenase
LEWQEPLRLECLDFVRCVGEGGQPLSDGLMGLKVVQVLEAAQASLNNGGTKEAVLW